MTVTEQVAKIIPYGHSFWLLSPQRHIHERCQPFMKRDSIILLLVVLGCHSKQLEIGQLQFGDFERKSLARHHIDTTYLIAKNPWAKYKFGELIGSSVNDTTEILNWKFMDVGFVVYDSLGRIISDESMRWEDYTYFYDSVGIVDSIVWRDWDVRPKYSSTYSFYPDSMVLLQKWFQRGGLRYIHRYEFGDNGEIIEEDSHAENGRPIMQVSYDYEDGKIKVKTESKYSRQGELDSKTKTHLYYSNQSRLDSTVSTVNSKEDGVYQMVTYYDSTGLKKLTILKDTITLLYRHTKRSR